MASHERLGASDDHVQIRIADPQKNWDRHAASITLEQGKIFAHARSDVLRGLQVAEAACAALELLKGEVLEVAKDIETRNYREPLGVVADICPFSEYNCTNAVSALDTNSIADFPAMIPLRCLPIATITGNRYPQALGKEPGATMILAELAKTAGFPDGVINIVHGVDKPRTLFLGSCDQGHQLRWR